jgi:hypothetical protein
MKKPSPQQILHELRSHAPFSLVGAISGIVLIFLFQNMPTDYSRTLFYIFHPIHVVLSALVTTSMYALHTCGRLGKSCFRGKCNLWMLLFVGYMGAIGIATLSDSIVPYLGETLLGMPNRGIHIGFIEKWWLVNPLAVLGIMIAFFRPSTKFPHGAHVMLSTWASLFHMIMAVGQPLRAFEYAVVLVFLFLAVWLPCCLSDIVFPLLFVQEEKTNQP